MTRAPFDRVVAVDWSGARAPAGGIAIAEIARRGGATVTTLTVPESREETIALLVQRVRAERVAIGLDFAFSFPAWFVARQGAADAPAFWRRVAARGEGWLATPPAPFQRTQIARQATARGGPLFRTTEGAISAGARITPKSVFQIGGSGQVGMSTLRGIPFLPILRAAGCAIWPFDDARDDASLVVEIYPRAVYGGAVAKASAAQRTAWLAAHAAGIAPDVLASAGASDHAFDAVASALAMWDAAPTLDALPPARTPLERVEGRIWTPGLAA